MNENAPMYETEAWSQGISLDEREDFYEATSMNVIAIWTPAGSLFRVYDANAANRRLAEMMELNAGFMWSEGDYWTIFPVVDTPGSAPLMGEAPMEDVWQGAAGSIVDALWALDLLTTPDRVEFTWEPVRSSWETERAESEARWVEARAVAADELGDSIEALMMEVPS